MAKKILRAASTVLLIALFLLVVAMFMMRVMGKTPSVFGFQVYYVATGSMEPTINTGDVVLIKKTPAEDIHKGDIITYKAVEGDMAGKSITHRVVEEPEYRNGTYYFQTRGDAEGAPLDPEFSYRKVEGKLVFRLPLIGKVYSFFSKPYGLLTFIIVILLLFGYEMIALFFSYRTIDSLDDDYLEPEKAEKKEKRSERAGKDDEITAEAAQNSEFEAEDTSAGESQTEQTED